MEDNAVGLVVGALIGALVGFVLLVVLLSVKEDMLTGENATIEVTGVTLTIINIVPWIFSLLIFGIVTRALVKQFSGLGRR